MMTGLNLMKSMAFVVIFCLLFNGAGWFFRPGIETSSSRIQREALYTVDVLFVGSSHIYCGINPSILWLDKGIASFNYVSAGQPLWTSYNFIIEALKTQSPTVIVLDVVYAYRDLENGYIDHQQEIFGTFPFSLNKLNMIKIGAEPKERISCVIDLLAFHTRWRDINIDSLPYTEQGYAEKSPFRFKGYWADKPVFTVADVPADYNFSNYPSTTELGELPEKNLLYLRKIIELAKDSDMELLLIKTPTAIPFENEDEQKAYNTVAKIAAAYQTPFIDFNKDEHRKAMGFDFTTDMWDEGHLNVAGAEKLSRYMAVYLKANYDLPDRRGDPAYSSWDEAAEGCLAYEASAWARMEAEQIDGEQLGK
jgi:hypothetical protein